MRRGGSHPVTPCSWCRTPGVGRRSDERREPIRDIARQLSRHQAEQTTRAEELQMHSIIYLVGLLVIVVALLNVIA